MSAADGSHDPLQGLLRLAGRYRGREPADDGGHLTGELSLLPIVGAAGLLLRYSLRTDGGTCVHEEFTLIGPSEDGRLVLWNLDDASRALHAYGLRDARAVDGHATYEFGGSAPTQDSPRISLVLEADGAVIYTCGSAPRGTVRTSVSGGRAVRMHRVD